MRTFIAFTVGVGFAAAALAQNPQPPTKPLQIPPTAGINQPGIGMKKAEKTLQGMERVRYLLKQLELSQEQFTNAEGLAETAFSAGAPEGAAPALDLDEVKSIWAELEKAQKENDKAKVDRLSEELRALGRSYQEQGKTNITGGSEKEFFENLERSLNDQQKSRLKDAIDRLATNPSGAVRPIDVLRTARKSAGFDDAQAGKLSAIETKFRTDINTRDAQAATAEERRTKLLDGLITETRGVLTPPQAELFDKRIATMRPAAEKPAAAAAPAAPAATP